jgi:predicted nucleic acid-binding protein
VSDAPPPVVVCDAGPIIHLDQLACSDLLADFPRVLVPEVVWQEVTRHRPVALTREGVPFERVAPAGDLSPELEALIRLLTLHRGEQQALQVAQAEPGCILLTDDSAARLAAQSLQLPVHGTIGILVRAIRRQQKTRDEVITLLRSLPVVSTLYIRQSFLEEIIREVEQSE